ncbi:uncharacterized protein LOC129939240 [Eupeodes corollae]|uniref:uncharacterized protein LOC129939240 n=1 Tax=Eupeodes corollae TaxID=290404 RepID=UPI00249370BB|nr:uncharacterized protein LOC129939240 [Eupeodes corollae]
MVFLLKVWTDWKSSIRKKLSHNKAEDVSTGGGPFNKFVVSPTEDAIAKICGIYTVVEGIPSTMDFGVEDEVVYGNNNSMPNNSRQVGQGHEAMQEVTEPALPATPSGRKRKRQTGGENSVEDLIAKQTKAIEQIGEKMESILAASSKLARVAKDFEHTMKNLQKSVDSLQNCLEARNEETKRHNVEIEN